MARILEHSESMKRASFISRESLEQFVELEIQVPKAYPGHSALESCRWPKWKSSSAWPYQNKHGFGPLGEWELAAHLSPKLETSEGKHSFHPGLWACPSRYFSEDEQRHSWLSSSFCPSLQVNLLKPHSDLARNECLLSGVVFVAWLGLGGMLFGLPQPQTEKALCHLESSSTWRPVNMQLSFESCVTFVPLQAFHSRYPLQFAAVAHIGTNGIGDNESALSHCSQRELWSSLSPRLGPSVTWGMTINWKGTSEVFLTCEPVFSKETVALWQEVSIHIVVVPCVRAGTSFSEANHLNAIEISPHASRLLRPPQWKANLHYSDLLHFLCLRNWVYFPSVVNAKNSLCAKLLQATRKVLFPCLQEVIVCI